MPEQPKSIVYIRPDTIGDLVIFTSALAQLQAAWPEACHTLVVRSGYEALAPLFPEGLRWLVTDINPFAQHPGEARQPLETLARQIDALEPDLIVAATLNRTWLEVAVAARYPAARRVVLGRKAVDPLFANRLKLDLRVDADTAFDEIVETEPTALDWESNHALVDLLLGRAAPRPHPTLRIPDAAALQAGGVLQGARLEEGEFVAVFPGGLANVPIKAWPFQRFGELVRWLQVEKNERVLLLGHQSEASILERVSQEAVSHGASPPAVWLGADGDLPLLTALLARARLYVGHDTGAMHIAAAVGRPVVGIFGGGHWPRFRPIGRRTVSVVQPMPCFGCSWDCRFGDAPCVKTIETADVMRAVETLTGNEGPVDPVLEIKNLSDETLSFVAAVSPRYAKLQTDRLERQHRIEELKREADSKDTEINSLKREADTKDGEIASIKISAEERKAEMEAIKAELEAECAQKDEEIASLKAEATTKDSEIAALKDVCNEREALIIVQDRHIKNFQATVAQLKLDLEQRERDVDVSARELAAARETLSKLPPDAGHWANLFHNTQVHVRNLEAMLAARAQEIAGLKATISNYAAGYGALEQVKYFGQLLAEKETVVQQLHRACGEREKVIQQLLLDRSGPLASLGRWWFAARKHVELKYWAPFNEWLFKTMVEDYWMKIGILQQYDRKPLVWDKLPKGKLAEAKLPQMALVTPSYGQDTFVESTLLSVLNQNYPKLFYVVQDGLSKDRSVDIIRKYASRLHHWESVKDNGQADAIRKGFAHLEARLGPDDIMAWLNSDDLLAPRSLRFVAEYFARHPDVDVVYGHRIIIDGDDREVGRWIMPRHDPRTLEWIDYVPQETLFWRKRVWDRVGGVDPSFQFALDWDLIARFQQANAKVVRLPYFLGCFRVHKEQKTSQHIHTVGNEEMIKIRSRFHGDRHSDFATIDRYARKARFGGALTARLASVGIRY